MPKRLSDWCKTLSPGRDCILEFEFLIQFPIRAFPEQFSRRRTPVIRKTPRVNVFLGAGVAAAVKSQSPFVMRTVFQLFSSFLSLRTHTHSRMLSEKSFLARTECHYMRRTHASALRVCKKNSFPVWLLMFSLCRGASVFHQHHRAPSSTGKTRSRETRILCGDFFSFFVHTIKHSNRQTRISRKNVFSCHCVTVSSEFSALIIHRVEASLALLFIRSHQTSNVSTRQGISRAKINFHVLECKNCLGLKKKSRLDLSEKFKVY